MRLVLDWHRNHSLWDIPRGFGSQQYVYHSIICDDIDADRVITALLGSCRGHRRTHVVELIVVDSWSNEAQRDSSPETRQLPRGSWTAHLGFKTRFPSSYPCSLRRYLRHL